MISHRPRLGIPLIAALAAALVACSPPRALEAARVLADSAAGAGPRGLMAATPAPRRAPVAYRVAGRARSGDLYRPGGEGASAAIVLVPGVAEAGKDDRRLVAFANTLARARFDVLVPDIENLRTLEVRAADSRAIADAVAYLASIGGVAAPRRLGIAAISYAVGPALIAALETDVAERVGFVVGIGGYHDIEAVVTFFTTGYYRERPGAPWRHRATNAYGKWVFVASNVERVHDARDRTTLEAMARRKLRDLESDVSDLAQALGAEGRAFHALLTNTDPESVPALIAALPPGVRAEMAALSPAHRDLGRLGAWLILVHGRDDDIIPFSESLALAAAVPGRADLFVIDGIAHIDREPPPLGRLQLWRAIYRLLEERDGVPRA